jgi:hypothetical protein
MEQPSRSLRADVLGVVDDETGRKYAPARTLVRARDGLGVSSKKRDNSSLHTFVSGIKWCSCSSRPGSAVETSMEL